MKQHYMEVSYSNCHLKQVIIALLTGNCKSPTEDDVTQDGK